eukprot:1148570-Pelagomonas_calceolata.AAC.1
MFTCYHTPQGHVAQSKLNLWLQISYHVHLLSHATGACGPKQAQPMAANIFTSCSLVIARHRGMWPKASSTYGCKTTEAHFNKGCRITKETSEWKTARFRPGRKTARCRPGSKCQGTLELSQDSLKTEVCNQHAHRRVCWMCRSGQTARGKLPPACPLHSNTQESIPVHHNKIAFYP